MKKRITVWDVFSFLLKIVLIVIFVFPFYWMITTGFKTYQESIATPPTLWPTKEAVSSGESIFAFR